MANRSVIVLLFWVAVNTATAPVLKGSFDGLDSGSAPTTLPPIFNSPPPYQQALPGINRIACTFGTSLIDDSLEWMAADASIIFVAMVTDVSVATRSVTTVIVKETIKGDLLPGATISFELSGRDQCVRGDQVLFFLNENKLSVLFRYKARAGRSAIVLNSPQAFGMDRSVLTKPQQIIDAVRLASKFQVDRTKKPVPVVCSSLMGGRTLLVPPDQRLEKLAQSWAALNSREDRVTALRALHDFKSEQNIAIARRLLWDTRPARGQGKWQIDHYPVRVEAHSLLVDWGIAHPSLPQMGPAYVYDNLSFSGAILLWPTGAGLLLMALVILRRSGHRALFSGTVGILCVAAISGLSWLWIRSTSTVDEVMFRMGENHHELASYHGGLQYQVLREWTLPPKMVFGSFDLGLRDDVWSAGALNLVVDRQSAGFMSGHGHIPGPGGVIHPYNVVRLPYWILILLFAIVLVYEASIVRRQVRRRRLGLCRHCGYDLRENPGGRCPECGIESGGRIETGEKAAIGQHPVGV